MLIELKIANYRSIKDEQTFSFVAEKASRHPDNLIQRKGFRLLKAAALFGANASGKSNLVKAIRVMRDYIRDSATRMNEGDPILLAEPFRLSPDTLRAPSRFEITFLAEETLYRYGFSATIEQVHEEWLAVQPTSAKAEILWFERRFDSARKRYEWTFGEPLKSVADILRERTRSNALGLSTGAQLNIKPFLVPYLYFHDNIQVFDLSQSTHSLKKITANYCKGNPTLQRRIVQLLRDADLDINDFRVEQESSFQSAAEQFLDLLGSISRAIPPEEKGAYLASRKITTLHRREDGQIVEFDLDNEESQGTQRFFAVIGPFLQALTEGAFFVVDELDCSMHPLLTRKLLELFQSARANTNGAQLLFTTHDAALFDQELFRRDQIWLAEKRNGATEFFSLMDVEPKPRNTEAFLRNYLAGRYGGVAHFGRSLENLEITATK